MRYSRRSSGSKSIVVIIVIALVIAGVWYFFLRGDNELEIVVVNTTPSPISRTYAKWESELEAGMGEKVSSEIKAAIDNGSEKRSAELLWLLADAYERAGEAEKRIVVLQQIIQEYSSSAYGARAREIISRTRGQATEMFLTGNYSQALEKFTIDLTNADEAQKPSILWYMGQCSYMLSNLESAQKYFERVTTEFPGTTYSADSYYGLSTVYFKKADFGKSLEFFDKGRLENTESAQCCSIAQEIYPILYQEFVETGKKLSRWDSLREMMCIIWKNKPDLRDTIEPKLDVLNQYLIFTPTAKCTDSEFYTIKYGDSLDKIGKKFGVEHKLLSRINGLSSDTIFPENQLKILKGRARVLVSKSNFKLTLLFADKYVKSYKVGIGKEGKDETPPGVFTVKSCEIDPIWYSGSQKYEPGDPRNILGTRWIGLSVKHYGIHGTPDETSLGKKDSAGCVRMRNQDVEEVYDFVRLNDEVIIED